MFSIKCFNLYAEDSEKIYKKNRIRNSYMITMSCQAAIAQLVMTNCHKSRDVIFELLLDHSFFSMIVLEK